MTEFNEGSSVDMGGTIDLDGGESSAESALPSVKTAEFEHPVGDVIPLPDPEGSSGIEGLERIIDENDLLPVWFLTRGAEIQAAVARVVLRKAFRGLPPGRGWATGFMVSPTLFMTNNHVIPNEAFMDKIRIQFNYQMGPTGDDEETEIYLPAADVFRTNPALDYTLIRLRPLEEGVGEGESDKAGDRWGYIELNDSPIYRKGQHFNIVQHPSGRQKEIALQDNEIDELRENVVRYKADTEPGSSGSPVFDNVWQLVALHHAGGEKDASGKWLNNQGIRVDAIVKDLRDFFADKPEILDELGI
jgi:V8-like Glu-specific endopeptidase